MPFANPFLKAVSSLDPCNRKTSVALELMKEPPLYASNVVQDSEKEACDLEIHNFQNDIFCDIVEESVDLWWRDVENTSKYPLLSRVAFALLTCFHEPKVESSFSIMNNVIPPGSNRLNVLTFNAMQCINVFGGRSGLVVRCWIGARELQVRNPVPLKIHHVWNLLHAKTYVGVKRPSAGVMWKFGDGVPAQVLSLSCDRNSNYKVRPEIVLMLLVNGMLI
ncbi:hypothetical protein AVEN_93024-1 [Araneus ventricosus]|uniref:HAT C-terminal dimerisation domain-containing protein n=1 Tax=Araneus ventricosus TaxID=182803 RepID=A0A4Y2TJQ2_ARAVE|nr:hypothetical protein AVEN_93024-1 [Araneus ventricosus]